MSGESNYSPYLIIGKLSRDFILTELGEAINDIPGGHLLYTAIGMSPWEKGPGLVARIGKNFPEEYLSGLKNNGFSLHGLKKIAAPLEHRNFISYFETENREEPENKKKRSVLSQYYNAGQPFPKELLGFNKVNGTENLAVRSEETILAKDIPPEFQESRCVHLCPLDYLSHNLLPQAFFDTHKKTITIHASGTYMHPNFFESIKTLVNGLTAFMVREEHLKNLFYEKYRIRNITEMMKVLLDFGAENIIVKRSDRSYIFLNQFDGKTYRADPGNRDKFEKIGSFSCFCGAYVIGLNTTYDFKKAVAYGAARESLLLNEWNPYHNLNVFDALLMEKVRIMENKIEECYN